MTIATSVVTAGSLRKKDAILGLLSCMGNTNDETLANMRMFLSAISAPCIIIDNAIVKTESQDAAAFLYGLTT